MAQANAQLGLIITAKDEASKVFMQFARNLANSLEGVTQESKELKQNLNQIGDAGAKDVKAVTDSTKTLNKTLDSTSDELKEVAKETKKFNEEYSGLAKARALQEVGTDLANLGHALTGFFSNAVKEGAHFQQQIDAIAATLNSRLSKEAKLSSEQVDILTQKTLELGSAGYFSANEIAETMYTLSREGVRYEQIVGGAMKSIQDLAVATDSNLNRTADVMNDVIHEMGDLLEKEFGKDLNKQFTEVANMISGAMHNARMTMEDFLGTLKYVGPQASAVGMSLKDVSLAIGLLANSGIKGSQAGTTLRRMLTNVIPATDEAANTMKKLGLITEDGGNKFITSSGKIRPFVEIQHELREALAKLTPMQQQQALKTMFGQYAMSGMSAIVNTTADEMKQLTADITEHSNAQELANAKWDNTTGSMRRLKAHYETIVKIIGENLIPVVEKLTGWAENLLKAFDSLPSGIKKTTIITTALGGVVLLVGGKIMTFIATIGFFKVSCLDLVSVLGATSASTAAVGTTMSSILGPIGLVIAALTAIGVAFFYAYSHSEAFRDGVNQVISEVVKFFRNELLPVATGVIQKVTAAVNEMMPHLKIIFKNGFELIKVIWDAFWSQLGPIVSFYWAVIKAELNILVDGILGIMKTFTALLAGDWKSAWETLKQTVKNIIDDILNILKLSIDKMWQAGRNLIQAFIDGFKANIPTPQFNVNGEINVNNPESKAAIGVRWFAEGGILTKPTLFGGGEAGPEAILPLSKLESMLNLGNSVNNIHGIGRTNSQVNNISITVNGVGKDGREIGNDIARQLRIQMAVVTN